MTSKTVKSIVRSILLTKGGVLSSMALNKSIIASNNALGP